MKEFTVIQQPNFRLHVRAYQCDAPVGLINLDFIQETLRNDTVDHTSIYNFFLTKEELSHLSQQLAQV